MYGRGGILRVDLSREKISREAIPDELCRKYIGGEGINTRLLWEHFLKVNPRIDPISGDNVIIWGEGPLGGTAYGAGSKSRWTFKGPAYNLFGDTTSGGAFGPRMRWAGYDHLVVTGRARRPVYIRVNNDTVELRDATHLWGKTVSEAEAAIRQELGDGEMEMAGIGPAGENLVRYASLTVAATAPRPGPAPAAFLAPKTSRPWSCGGARVSPYMTGGAFYKAINALLEAIYRHKADGGPWAREHFLKYGNLGLAISNNVNGWNGYRNGQGGQSPEIDKLSGEWYFDHMQQRPLSCSPSCAAACQAWHYVKGDESPLASRHIGQHGQRPALAMVASFGVNCDIPDLPALAHLMDRCNDYNLDCFEAGMSISFLMELWQRGIIAERDMVEWTGEPMSLEWGNIEAAEKILESIGRQINQLGKILSGGVYQAAKRIEELKGVPVSQYANYGKGGATHQQIMRNRPSMPIMAAVSLRGPTHGNGVDERSSTHYFGKPDAGLPFSSTLKGAGHALSEYFTSMYNSLGVCRFGGAGIRNMSDFPPELYTPVLYALTGMEITPEELFTACVSSSRSQGILSYWVWARRQKWVVMSGRGNFWRKGSLAPSHVSMYFGIGGIKGSFISASRGQYISILARRSGEGVVLRVLNLPPEGYVWLITPDFVPAGFFESLVVGNVRTAGGNLP